MNDVSYSHELVWQMIHTFPDMDYARHNEPLKWRLFTTTVGNETANAYSSEISTADVINQMADDLGSYRFLADIWLSVEDVFNQNCDSDSDS